MTRVKIIHPTWIEDYMEVNGSGRRYRIATRDDANREAAAAVRGMDPYDKNNGCIVLVIERDR
jgi:hypothetical protein